MIFRQSLVDAILRGDKTATRRLAVDNPNSPWWRGGCPLKVGRSFAVQAGRGQPAIARAIPDRVAMERLGAATHTDAKREGFPNLQSFFEEWQAINGAFDPLAWVWVIEFHLPGQYRQGR